MATTLTWTLGDLLNKARRQAGISVEEMAKQLDVTPKTINNIERDRVPVRRAYILGYSVATGIDLSELDRSDLAVLHWRCIPGWPEVDRRRPLDALAA